MRKRDARAATAANAAQIRLCVKAIMLDWRKVPELAEEFAKQKSQKHETRQILTSWRRGRDSNPRYGYPYAAFRVRCFQPLSHLSVAARRKHPVGRRLCIQRETVKQERSVAHATARHEPSGARGRQKNLATSVALARGHALPDP